MAANADLVAYWPEKAREAIEAGEAHRAGFVATQAIRTGGSREVLERINRSGRLFMAWQNEPWLQDGAAVRVSLFAFDNGTEPELRVDGLPVSSINASLSGALDVRTARTLKENAGMMFMGTTKVGPFDIPAGVARGWLDLPNPTGHSNQDVVRPWVNGSDVVRRPSDRWIIDFGVMTEAEASQYVLPFEYVQQHVKPERLNNNRVTYRERWWQHAEPRPALRAATQNLTRLLITPRVAKHRIWAWVPSQTVPDSRVLAVARDDDYTFGVLHSSVHEVWTLANSAAHGDGEEGGRPTYVSKTCFDPFPFPRPTVEQSDEISHWARFVVQLREHLLAQDASVTLTGIYNEVVRLRTIPDPSQPVSALINAHTRLDQAVAAAYGWDWPLSEDDLLSRLLALNLERAGAEG